VSQLQLSTDYKNLALKGKVLKQKLTAAQLSMLPISDYETHASFMGTPAEYISTDIPLTFLCT
jgi:hypothetical protein